VNMNLRGANVAIVHVEEERRIAKPC